MPLATFSSPSDVRLITFDGEIFKIKVISHDIQSFHQEHFTTEVEQVIRAFLQNKNKKKLEKVQTERFLFNMKKTRWKAAEMLRFTQDRHPLRVYPQQIEFTVSPKPPTESQHRSGDTVSRKRPSEKDSNIPKKKTRYAEKPQHFLTVDMGVPVNCETNQSVNIPSIPLEENDKGTGQLNSKKEHNKANGNSQCNGSHSSQAASSHVDTNSGLNGDVDRNNQGVLITTNTGTNNVNSGDESHLNLNNNNMQVSGISKEKNSNSGGQKPKLVAQRRLKLHSQTCLEQDTEHLVTTRNVQAYTRDRALIQQEDLAEEMKLQELSTPAETGRNNMLSRDEKDSMLRAAMELIMTPVKLLFHKK